ncbi:MAG: dihydrodipicolinate synthase family protein, partial [Clostridia bacterium]|nr:dihydrodipicolinate synthase family protein [Clostridia bacterium]
MTGFLKGSATAMITPFENGTVNLNAFGEMIEYQIENGTDALVV